MIVVRLGPAAVDLRCGGVPMTGFDAERATDATIQPDHRDGTVLGKRYTDAPGSGLEILVTKAGAGSLSDGATPLVLKGVRPLPASD